MEIREATTNPVPTKAFLGHTFSEESLAILAAAKALPDGHTTEIVFEDVKSAGRRRGSLNRHMPSGVKLCQRGASLWLSRNGDS